MTTNFLKTRLARIACATALLTQVSAAHATGVGDALITDITVEGTQYARVCVNRAVGGTRPACHNPTYSTHYAFDISTAKGKALLSILQAAQLAGKKINITGWNVCTNLGNEQIETIYDATIYS